MLHQFFVLYVLVNSRHSAAISCVWIGRMCIRPQPDVTTRTLFMCFVFVVVNFDAEAQVAILNSIE